MEDSQSQKNKDNKFDLLRGLFITLILSGLLFVEYENINKVVFLLLFVGGVAGLIQISTVSVYKVAERGFLWRHYIMMSVQLTMIYLSGFDFIFELFVITNSILLFKNLLGLYLIRNNREYF